MTPDKEPEKKEEAQEAPARPRRSKQVPTSGENGATSRQEAVNTRRPRRRASSSTSLATPSAVSAKPATTDASTEVRKASDVPEADADLNAPSTSKGLSQKAPQASRKPRTRSRSSDDGHPAAYKTSKLGHRARSHSRGRSNPDTKKGSSRHRTRHSSRSARNRGGPVHASSATKVSRGKKTRGRRSSRSTSTTTSMTTRSGRKQRRHGRSRSSRRRGGKRTRSTKTSSTASSRPKRNKTAKTTKKGKEK